MGTKNNPGEFGCYAAAEPDEPMFTLLGRDPHAASLVWLWAVMREIHAAGRLNEPGFDAERAARKIKEARELAVAMVLWSNEHGKKCGGMAESVLAGVFELIRGANYGAKCAQEKLNLPESANDPTSLDAVRAFFTASEWASGVEKKEVDAPAEAG